MADSIQIDRVSKMYRLGQIGTGTISHDLNRWWSRIRGKEDPYLKVGETNDRSSKGESEYVWALKDINFEVKRGEVLGIIGPNGAGKTSLIEILSGRYKQKTGDVIYKDQVINDKPLYERARMGIGRTYQTPVVPEELTVGETLKAARQSTKPYLLVVMTS